MKKLTQILAIILLNLPVVLIAQTYSPTCIPCEKLKDLRIPDVIILKAESLKNDSTQGITVPFCRVFGRISKEINFELNLPAKWNKRFLMSGGGGFVGSIQNFISNTANAGYANVGTDAGHQAPGIQADWAVNNMERQLNFGRLAIHRTATVSRFIIHAYYCADPAYSYFMGCSRGGGQAMIEAQQYPEDFDGFVAGAPAIRWPALGAKFIQHSQQNYPDTKDLSKHVITKDNLRILQEQILKQCDGLDGIVDSILNDPRDCKFDFSTLPVCPEGQASSNCFTPQQLQAIKTVYTALANKQDTIYPGFPYGAENEAGSWDVWIAGNNPSVSGPSWHFMFGTELFKYLVLNNPEWNYADYDFSNFFKESRFSSSFLDASETDYTEFKKRKRKMIMYHGWNDPALSAFETIHHYEQAEQKDKNIQSSIRLFLLPGVLHCEGGPGPDKVDWIRLIREWVENGKAPERLVVSKIENNKTVMTRAVFPYPKVAVYSGHGDTNQEKNFVEKKN